MAQPSRAQYSQNLSSSRLPCRRIQSWDISSPLPQSQHTIWENSCGSAPTSGGCVTECITLGSPDATGGGKGAKRPAWTPAEDEVLIRFVDEFGPQKFNLVRENGLLSRDGKSCRQRWSTWLKPGRPNQRKSRGRIELNEGEEEQLFRLQAELGNQWSKMAPLFPRHTPHEIKNLWHGRIKKKYFHPSPSLSLLPSPGTPLCHSNSGVNGCLTSVTHTLPPVKCYHPSDLLGSTAHSLPNLVLHRAYSASTLLTRRHQRPSSLAPLQTRPADFSPPVIRSCMAASGSPLFWGEVHRPPLSTSTCPPSQRLRDRSLSCASTATWSPQPQVEVKTEQIEEPLDAAMWQYLDLWTGVPLQAGNDDVKVNRIQEQEAQAQVALPHLTNVDSDDVPVTEWGHMKVPGGLTSFSVRPITPSASPLFEWGGRSSAPLVTIPPATQPCTLYPDWNPTSSPQEELMRDFGFDFTPESTLGPFNEWGVESVEEGMIFVRVKNEGDLESLFRHCA